MRTLLKIASPAIFLIFALICSCSKDNLSLPKGWRTPVASDISADEWRKEDNNRFLIAKGDFNGDGIVDIAKLLIRQDGSGWGLFVFLFQGPDSYKPYLLDETNHVDSMHMMGIQKVNPGIYETACGKGYWECDKDEMPEISIKNDAIDYFRTESANSYFYWDVQTSTFKRIWISD